MRPDSPERSLSEQIEGLYLICLGHKPTHVYCKLLEQMLVITVEDPITQIERVLMANDKQQLAEQARDAIDQAFQPQLIGLIERVLQVSVVDIISNSNLYTDRTVVTAILADELGVEKTSSPLQFRQKKASDISSE